MISTNLNENSTNVSPAQSPGKSKNQIYSNILLPHFNLNLQKVSEGKKNFEENQTDFLRFGKMEMIKDDENPSIKRRINRNLLNKKIDKKNNLLDFDFLVGEIFDKINFKNNLSISKVKKKDKFVIKQRKIIKSKKYNNPSLSANKKSKLIYINWNYYFIFIAESKSKTYQESKKNLIESPKFVNLNKLFSRDSTKKIKINRREKVHVQKKDNKNDSKTKISYLELSDDFFLQKSIEVSFKLIYNFSKLVKRKY